MARTAFFTTDEIDGQIVASGPWDPDMPQTNVSKDSPGIQARVLEGVVNLGWFEVGSTNKWIDIDEGTGDVGVAFTVGRYTSPGALRDEIATQLNAAAGLSDTYTVTWLNGVFSIGSSGTFSISWLNGTHTATSIGQELGYSTAADTSTAASHVAGSKRYSTAAAVVVDLGSATLLSAFLWYAEGGNDGATAAFNDVNAYVDTSFRGFHRDAWTDASSTEITLSDRQTTQAVNQIQVGFQDPSTATARRWAFISWRHFDESQDHRIGLCKAFKVTWDTTNTRTIGPLRGHRQISAAPPRSLSNYYAPPGIVRWRTSMQFDDWEVASWEEVVLALSEHGYQKGTLWCEDFGTLRTASDATVLTDVDRGLVLWSTIQNIGGGDAAGSQDLYRTADLALEQLR